MTIRPQRSPTRADTCEELPPKPLQAASAGLSQAKGDSIAPPPQPRPQQAKPQELAQTGKSVDRMLAIAASLKCRLTVTSRRLENTRFMANLNDARRKIGARMGFLLTAH